MTAVTIDPEDTAQVEQFVRALRSSTEKAGLSYVRLGAVFGDERVSVVQDALRSLIAPPKPEEPTGLGAVVEDTRGRQWLRSDRIPHGAYWMCADEDLDKHYADIDVAKVLSEGVTR